MNFGNSTLQPPRMPRPRTHSFNLASTQKAGHPTASVQFSFQDEEPHSSYKSLFDEKLRKQTQQLFEENETLKGRVELLTSSIEHLNERVRRKDQQLHKAISNSEIKTADLSELRDTVDELARKNKNLKKQVRELQGELKCSREELRLERQLRVELQAEKNTIQQKLQSLLYEGEELADQIYTEKLAKITHQHKEELDKVHRENSRLKKNVEALQQQINLLNQTSKDYSTKASTEIISLQGELRKLNEKLMQMQQAAKLSERLRQQREQTKANIKQFQQEHDLLTAKCEQLEAKYDELTNKYEQLLQRNGQLINQNKSAENEIKLLQSKIRTLQENPIRSISKLQIIEPVNNYSTNDCGKAISSYLLDDQYESHQSRQTHSSHHSQTQNSDNFQQQRSLTLQNFNSINIQSFIDKNCNKSSALQRLLADDSKIRLQNSKSLEEENVLLNDQYVPAISELSNIDENSHRRVAGGIRSRCNKPESQNIKRHGKHQERRPTNEVLISRSNTSRQEAVVSSEFQQLINRFEQIKSRSREKIL